MKEITVQAFAEMQKKEEKFTLIDVREPWEYEKCNIGGISMPMGEVQYRLSEIPREKKVIVCCYKGTRSAKTIDFLERIHQFQNLYNLRGGLLSYGKEINKSLPLYSL